MPKNAATHQRKTQTRAGTVEKAKAVKLRAVEAKAFVKAKAVKAKAERAVAAPKAVKTKAVKTKAVKTKAAKAKAAKAKAAKAPQSPTYEPSQTQVCLEEGPGCIAGAAPTPTAPEGGRLSPLTGNRGSFV